MEHKSVYFTHKELCDLMGIPEDNCLVADEYSLIWWPPAGMWKLSMRSGTDAEIDLLQEEI